MSFIHKLGKLLSRPAVDPVVDSIYRACIDQTRRAVFYRELGVVDSIDGRFDLLLLHVILVMRRLGPATELRQQLFDLMFADMDRNLREMGVGDMSIGKKIKPMLQAFYGRFQAYEQALAAGDDAIAAALQRNLYNNAPLDAVVLTRMVSYVRLVAAALDLADDASLANGQVAFPSVPALEFDR